jgi:opacity protein-like surface antigen
MEAVMALRFRLFALLILAPALHAAAQDRTGTVEITPFGGGYFGGRLYAGSNVIFTHDVDVKTAGTYGIRVAVNANPWLGIEAGFSTADADIRNTSGSGLFGSSETLGKLRLYHYELDGVFNLGRRRVIPYIALGGGATTFRARVSGFDATDDTRFTANLGAGLKAYVTPHLAFRFDGRYRAAYVNDCSRSQDSGCEGNRDRNRDDRHRWYGSAKATGGLTFAF